MARILLVEDEADLRDNIEIVLGHAGHDVIGAGNGREALDKLAHLRPDLLISDISMPEMDGVALVRRVRESMPALAEMPIILLTALGDKEHLIDGRNAGADEYLTKPIDYQILSATINARLSRARQALDLKEKQFVRLFKELSSHAHDHDPVVADARAKTGQPSPADPLGAVRALADPTLHGRAAVYHLEEHIPAYADLPQAKRDKALALMRRVLSDVLGPDDASVELGTGSFLVALSSQDREVVAGKLALINAHLDHGLGAEDIVAGGGGGHDNDGDDVKMDGETKTILRKLFDRAADNESPETRRQADFHTIAKQFQFDYLPIWRVQNQKVEAYLLRWRRRCDGAVLTGDGALLGGTGDPMAGALVSLALEAAAQELRALAAAPSSGPGNNPMIIVPVGQGLLNSPSYTNLMKKLEELNRAGDGRWIGLHLAAAPSPAAATSAKAGQTDAMAPAGNLILNDFRADWLAEPVDASTPHRLVHIDAAAAERTACPHTRMRAALMETIRQANNQGFSVWVSNVDTSPVARLAVSAGAKFLSGKCIGGGRPTPNHPKKMTSSQVLMTM